MSTVFEPEGASVIRHTSILNRLDVIDKFFYFNNSIIQIIPLTFQMFMILNYNDFLLDRDSFSFPAKSVNSPKHSLLVVFGFFPPRKQDFL